MGPLGPEPIFLPLTSFRHEDLLGRGSWGTVWGGKGPGGALAGAGGACPASSSVSPGRAWVRGGPGQLLVGGAPGDGSGRVLFEGLGLETDGEEPRPGVGAQAGRRSGAEGGWSAEGRGAGGAAAGPGRLRREGHLRGGARRGRSGAGAGAPWDPPRTNRAGAAVRGRRSGGSERWRGSGRHSNHERPGAASHGTTR